MPRKKKSVLNQKAEEPKEVMKTEEVSDDSVVGWVNPELKKDSTEEIIKELEKNHLVDAEEEVKEISLKVSGEKLSEVLEKKAVPEEPKEEVVEEKVDETPRPAGVRSLDKDVLKRLTHRELRLYQRTGILPK